jgi:outer membrane protein assembly factor BamB
MANAATRITVDDLGEAARVCTLALQHITRDPDGHHIGWAAYEAADKYGIIGVRLDNGEVIWLETTRFGRSHIQMTKAADGNLYAYTGNPGHFLKYDASKRELVDLGVPAKPASYWLGSAVGPDGCFYVGTYPQTTLVRCDPRTGKVDSLGRLSDDPKECYIIHPAISDDNIVYCPVGLHHRELWAVDAINGKKKQILPPHLTKAQGAPSVWIATDGQVYGRAGGTEFLCRRDGITVGKTKPPRRPPNALRIGDKLVGSIGADGRLPITDTKTKTVSFLQTRYEGSPRHIFSVGCERDGCIYGGTAFPAFSFRYDTRTGCMTNFGILAGGPVQVYDTLNHPKGLFLSSYMNASVDFFDPSRPVRKPDNPRHIITVNAQERPVQLVIGPDEMLYTGTGPSKGRLGGALVRVNPDDFSHKTWTQIVTNQSIYRLVGVPKTGELLGTTSISGGSSAIPTEKEACIFLWNCKQEKVVFTAQPLLGTKTYGAVVHATNGLVYGVVGGENKFYVFDPIARKTVFTGVLPVKGLHFPELADEPFGPRGLIYGLAEDTIFAIDPADHSAKVVVRDPALKQAYGFCIAHDGMLYFGSGSHLMRCKLPKQE